MVGGLLDVPAEAEAEREAACGEVVEGRDLLGEADRVVLGDQRDAGTEAEALGDRGGLAERDEGVEGAAVLGRQVAARRVRRHALDQARMSSRHLGRHFRHLTGTTPLQWLHTRRIRHAQELLETTDATVDTIAAATGMGTATTLRRHFHRSVGVPPDTYRRTFRP